MSEKQLKFGQNNCNDTVIKEKKDNIDEINSVNVIDVISNGQIIIKKSTENDKILEQNKCQLNSCNRKLSLTEKEIKCKCGNIFCSKHRHTAYHDCKFDFKKNNKELLAKNLDKIIGEKINKI